jgi:hypothetical protein
VSVYVIRKLKNKSNFIYLFFPYCVSEFVAAIDYLKARIYLLPTGFHLVRSKNIVLRQQLRNARLEI